MLELIVENEWELPSPKGHTRRRHSFPFLSAEVLEFWKDYKEELVGESIANLDDEVNIYQYHDDEALQYCERISEVSQQHGQLILSAQELITGYEGLLLQNGEIENETETFRKQSELPALEVSTLSSKSQALGEYLCHFENLETIVHALNTSASANLAASSRFKDTVLVPLDKSFSFVNSPEHDTFQDIEIYRIRFKQCLVRAMALLKSYILGRLQRVNTDISFRLNAEKSKRSGVLPSVTVDALIYNKFDSECEDLARSTSELFRKSEAVVEIQRLVDDCHTSYFRVRSSLLSDSIHDHFQSQSSVGEAVSLVNQCRKDVLFCYRVCQRELKSFRLVFCSRLEDTFNNRRNEDAIHRWITQDLLQPFYDRVRKAVLRESRITNLCDFLLFFQHFFDKDELSQTSDDCKRDTETHAFFDPIVQDVQSRLIFRVQIFIDKNIKGSFMNNKLHIQGRRDSSQDDDLDQVDKPHLDRKMSVASMSAELESLVSEPSISTDARVSDILILPPISKSAKLLSRIYQLMDQKVFNDLANNLVLTILRSLSEKFSPGTSLNGLSPLETKLCLIANLAYLETALDHFGVETTTTRSSVEFTGISSVLNRFSGNTDSRPQPRKSGSRFLGSFLGSLPKVVNEVVDARLELSQVVHTLVEDFVRSASDNISSPLSVKIDTIAAMHEFQNNVKQELPKLKTTIAVYSSSAEFLATLIDAVQGRIVQDYSVWLDSQPQSKKEDLMEPDVLVHFMSDVMRKAFDSDVHD